MTAVERWQHRIDAIVEYFAPELGLERAQARFELRGGGQPAGWAPRLRPLERTEHDGDAPRWPWLRRRRRSC